MADGMGIVMVAVLPSANCNFARLHHSFQQTAFQMI
jgi:hypothetical protein